MCHELLRPARSLIANNPGPCYTVENLGGMQGMWAYQKPGNAVIGKPVTVEIIESCPAGHPQNCCKTQQPDPAEKCQTRDTNSLNINLSPYLPLNGMTRTDDVSLCLQTASPVLILTAMGLPNLDTRTTETPCPGEISPVPWMRGY